MGPTLRSPRPLARLGRLAHLTVVAAAPAARAQQEPKAPPEPSIDLPLARQVFAEIKERCAVDNGRLWGLKLGGPILLVDPATGTLVANQADPAHEFLQEREGVFVGTLPDTLQTANTSVDWAGARWAMIQWPLPEDTAERCRLVMHEVFHRVQDELNLPAHDSVCGHLDTLDGRFWLQLEWRALAEALRQARTVCEAGASEQATPGDPRNAHAAQPATTARNDAIRDALLFRRARRALIPGAAEHEHALEMNEGLAEYTGMALRGSAVTDTLGVLADRMIARAASLPSYARSWAYQSGPAWGLLLDQLAGRDEGPQAWRAGLTQRDDLAELAGAALRDPPPDTADAAGVRALLAAADKAARNYDGETLHAAEVARNDVRQAELARWRALLVEGPLLELPLSGAMNYTFDPNAVVSLEGAGTVYPTFTLTDAWGSLKADSGALMAADHGRTFVAAPAAVDASRATDSMTDELHGPGWTLKLSAGWHLVLGTRRGDYLVRSVLADAR